mgnify:CR=1 FL=1
MHNRRQEWSIWRQRSLANSWKDQNGQTTIRKNKIKFRVELTSVSDQQQLDLSLRLGHGRLFADTRRYSLKMGVEFILVMYVELPDMSRICDIPTFLDVQQEAVDPITSRMNVQVWDVRHLTSNGTVINRKGMFGRTLFTSLSGQQSAAFQLQPQIHGRISTTS